LRARQYGPLAAAEGRPTGLPTFLTPTPRLVAEVFRLPPASVNATKQGCDGRSGTGGREPAVRRPTVT
ncbi:MAG: hypothetical protein KAY37_14900, partial [Phycisphaerae bacterium]|nr:hypothetical protein [Phycisphaerae bacterium]